MDATGLDAVERLQLTGQDSPSILVALSKYGKIIDVHLDQCEICDDDAAIMGKMLSEHSLSSFALTNSTVSPYAMKEITAEMFRSSSLKSVNFRGNNLDNDAAMSIAASLSGNRTLLDMDLRDNELHYDGADVIARLLTDGLSLQRLWMANNRIGRGFSTISLAMSADKTVRVLDLSNNSITDEDATRLASFVANNESLVELNMERNWLGDSVAPLIVGALCRNTTLKTLNLNKNSFTNEAMKAFAIAIKFNSTMTHLHLAYARGVDAQGAQYVVSALEDNYTLVELELRYVKGPANAVARTMRQAVALLFRNKDITDRKHPTCFNEDKDPTTVSTFKTLHLVSPGLELDSTSFTNLETLVMTFVVLDFYDAVLRGLVVLDLRNNALQRLPGSSLAPLQLLRVIKLSNNRLEYLPVELAHLPALEELHLWRNPLGQIRNLKAPILGTSLDDFHTSPLKDSRLMLYLRGLEESCVKNAVYNRAKVMLVGHEKMGKTTLLDAFHEYSLVKEPGVDRSKLRRGTAPKQINLEALMTDGIAIRDIAVSDDVKKQEYQFACWDFAGQEYYYTTHVFFLTSKTIYLVVVNLKEVPNNFSKIDYWVRSIVAKASRTVPIVLVGTHLLDAMKGLKGAERRQKKENIMKLLTRRYSVVSEVIFVDSKATNDKYMKSLKKAIITAGTKRGLLGKQLPEVYSRLEKRLGSYSSTHSKGFISYQEYQDILLGCGVQLEQTDVATTYLKQIGSILHWSEDSKLKDIVFTDPQFLCDVFSSVVSYKTAVSNLVQDGVMRKSTLDNLWAKHSPEMRESLLRLLENFDVVIPQVLPHESAVLIPALLPLEAPVGVDAVLDSINDKKLRFYERLFVFNFLPLGFINKCIARCFKLSHVEVVYCWQNGVVLKRGVEIAKLTFSPIDYTLSVRVIGDRNAALLVDTVRCVEGLIQAWFNKAVYDVKIPFKYPPIELVINQRELTRLISHGVFVFSTPDGRIINIDNIAPDLCMNDLAKITIDPSLLGPREQWNELGRGGFGTVYSTTLRGEKVAVKLYEKTAFAELTADDAGRESARMLKEFADEARIWAHLSQVQHRNVVQMRGILKEPSIGIVMEYVPNGDLHSLLKRKPTMSWFMKLRIMLDIAQGMNMLHRMVPPVVHFDLRSPNILIASMDEHESVFAKVSDFGLSAQLYSKFGESRNQSWQWLAPEVILEHGLTEKSDIYSFAMIMWEVWSGDGQVPYEKEGKGVHAEDMRNSIARGGLRPALPDSSDQFHAQGELASLMQRCWSASPEDRPEFAEVVTALQTLIGSSFKTSKFMLDTDVTTGHQQLSLPNSPLKRWQQKVQNNLVNEKHDIVTMLYRPEQQEVWFGYSDNQIKIWDMKVAAYRTIAHSNQPQTAPSGVQSPIWNVVQPDASTENDAGSPTPKQTPELEQKSSFRRGNRRITGMISHGDLVWVVSEDKTICIYKNMWLKARVPIDTHPLCICKHGHYGYVGCSDGRIIMIDLDEDLGNENNPYKYTMWQALLNFPVTAITVDDKFIWAATGGDVKILDKADFRVLFTWPAHKDRIKSLLRIDQNLWTCSEDRMIRVWSLRQAGSSVWVMWERDLPHHSTKVMKLARVGDMCVSGADSVVVWDKNFSISKILTPAARGLVNDVLALDDSTIISVTSTNFNKVDGSRDNRVTIWQYL